MLPAWLKPDQPCLPDESEPFCRKSVHELDISAQHDTHHVANVVDVAPSGRTRQDITPLEASGCRVFIDNLFPIQMSSVSVVA